LEASSTGSNGKHMNVNILERVKALYDECGTDMFKDISAYLAYGYIHKTPKSFILAKTVNLNNKTKPSEQWGESNPNAWFVHMAVGEGCISEWIKIMPFELPYVGWGRETKKRGIKFYELNKILRRK